ncbi:MAG: enoyl-CoA hydratase/isomerase family protein [Alphaproteobacteria bacterium]|nr:enoyl-CoA hydratase/isomerase family protein [Alphaproteobacteria bacterium]
MSDTPLLIEEEGPIALLTMNRPDTHNAITHGDTVEAFEAAAARLNASSTIRVGILTGAGRSFSAGGDLRAMHALLDAPPEEIAQTYRRGIQRIPLAMASIRIPMIAAVNGAAIGAGLDLACMCDIRIASDKARFAESFVKLGIIPGDGGSWFLPRILGPSKAAELSLTGDTIDAAEALRIGLVSSVVAPDALMDAARALAGRIAANPPLATRGTKRLLAESQSLTLAQTLELAANLQALCHKTAENRAAVEAFLAKAK